MLALFKKFGKVIKIIKKRRKGIQMALATVQANSLKIADSIGKGLHKKINFDCLRAMSVIKSIYIIIHF